MAKTKENIQKVSRKFNKIKEKDIRGVSIEIATKEDIKEWSHGEVTKPETINYKSYKPERHGLFDEVIFGPQTDYRCPVCGFKYKRTNEGQICEKTDSCKIEKPEIISAKERRTRMGHIELGSPVVHFWFLKIDHSIISKLLSLRISSGDKKSKKKSYSTGKTVTKKEIEDITYFKSHIVLNDVIGTVDGKEIRFKNLTKNTVINVNKAPQLYLSALEQLLEYWKDRKEEGVEDAEYAIEDIEDGIAELTEIASSKIGKDYGVDYYELNDIIEDYSEAKISTGAKAIEALLENFDLAKEIRRVKKAITEINKEIETSATIKKAKLDQRKKFYKRLSILEGFKQSGQDLKSMLIYNLPVIPADLRPLIQIDGGRHSTSDINELYRRIIIRNERLKSWLEKDAPVLIIQNELRMLQEAVDALIDNSRKKPSIMSKDNRPLKSISDALSGKKGRFRQNLLGKRVDYSGRSVIVVGPNLKMHQAGIPREMVAKLFEPWIIKELIDAEEAQSIKQAKKLIEERKSVIWPFVEKAIKGKVVLLNRAPTLHRLSVQAFEPVLIRGKAMRLHPLATAAFNADFDGDQMAVHVPISEEAIQEAKDLMLANKNILGPKDGQPIINPSQDMILGLYYITTEKVGAKGEGNIYKSYDELIKAHDLKKVDLHARVFLPVNKVGKHYLENKEGYIMSSVGKFIFNRSFPATFPFVFDTKMENLRNDYNGQIYPYGTNLREVIQNTPVNEAHGKKHIAAVVRKVFDEYTAVIPKEDIASIVAKLGEEGFNDNKLMSSIKSLKTLDKESINDIHRIMLLDFITTEKDKFMKQITVNNGGVERFLESSEKAELFNNIWFTYSNVVADSLDKIKHLGFKYSMVSGITMSIADIIPSPKKLEIIAEADKEVNALKEDYELGLLTDDERYKLVIKKWSDVKTEVEVDLKQEVDNNPDNPIFIMMKSGARGNISNFIQLAGLRGLMTNTKKAWKAHILRGLTVRSTTEIPVKSSFLDGLTAYEFYTTTPGARKGLADTALNTAQAGYLTRRLVDAAQNVVVREEDCGTSVGHWIKPIVDTKEQNTIVALDERIEGRILALDVVTSDGEVIAKKGTFVSVELAKEIEASGVEQVSIRSVLGCQTINGVCKICYGKDLATNRMVQIGEPVGIVAAQSIGEPGTQLTMRTFHTGGVAGVENIVGGFSRLTQLIDVTSSNWGNSAKIASSYGVVEDITSNDLGTKKTVSIVYDHTNEVDEVVVDIKATLRVQIGSRVKPGSKISEGPIDLIELLRVAGRVAVQNYFIKEIQRVYRMQGISISDKYVEIIIRQIFSRVIIQSAGESNFFAGEVVSMNKYQQENTRLLKRGKKPAIAQHQINFGVKNVSKTSESFLASASYMETAKVLVHSAIYGKQDELEGLKENIILGRKIPAGTSVAKVEARSKYDVKQSIDFFKKAPTLVD